MNRLKRILYPLLILILIIGLIIVFRSYLMENFIRPVALLLWRIWLGVISVDQRTYWFLLIFICGFLALRLIPRRKELTANRIYQFSCQLPGRVEHWRNLILKSGSRNNSHDQPRASLQRLSIRILTEGVKTDRPDADEWIASEIETIPPEVKAFLFPEEGKNNVSRPGKKLRLRNYWPGRKNTPRETELIEKTIQWLENELEIQNEF
ncbi:MAG: hypothetical protein JXA25_07400 [Anaerolineales bacterium]|nr:hypothetical protein [Anaerolineales bacterium]